MLIKIILTFQEREGRLAYRLKNEIDKKVYSHYGIEKIIQINIKVKNKLWMCIDKQPSNVMNITELEKEVNRSRWLFIMLNKLKITITYFNQSFLSK